MFPIFLIFSGCGTKTEQGQKNSITASIPQFTWPLQSLRFTSFFGENRRNHFHNGIDLSSHKEEVFSSAKGHMIYQWRQKDHPFSNMPGTGNWAAIHHNKDWTTIYLHLDQIFPKKKVEPLKLKNQRFEDSKSFARTGNSGRSMGSHLHFGLYKIRENSFVNPLPYLPPISDQIKPSIKSVYIRYENQTGITKLVKLKDGAKIESISKEASFFANILDHRSHNELHRRLGIYSLKGSINREVNFSVKFDKIQVSDNGSRVEGKQFSKIFTSDKKYFLTKSGLRYGKNIIWLEVADLQGNLSRKKILFFMNRSE